MNLWSSFYAKLIEFPKVKKVQKKEIEKSTIALGSVLYCEWNRTDGEDMLFVRILFLLESHTRDKIVYLVHSEEWTTFGAKP